MKTFVSEKKVAGLDPSLSNSAIAIGNASRFKVYEVPTSSGGDTVSARMERCKVIVSSIVDAIRHEGGVVAVYVEDYAFSQNGAHHSRIIEAGALLRNELIKVVPRVVEVKATTLKKFVTGKGIGKKSVMLAHIQKRWDQLFESDDAGDAYGLYRLGMCVEGMVEPETVAMREAVKTVGGNECGG